jgi:DNA-binding YbaB/EbfC family protein
MMIFNYKFSTNEIIYINSIIVVNFVYKVKVFIKMDMLKMLGKMNEVQQKMETIKSEAANVILEESELDGALIVYITGGREVKKITTSDEFYTKYSKEEREDILTEAVNNAIQKADLYVKNKSKQEMEGVLPNIPGMNMDDLLGKFSL